MGKRAVLWIDDEIDAFKPHIIFLKSKGYDIITIDNGSDAIDILKETFINAILLDHNMIGLSGLETLDKIRNISPEIPVVMITKSDEEILMEEALGRRITDYLIKPVNPKQILLCLKKVFENKKLVSENTTMAYMQGFKDLSISLNNISTAQQWVEHYKKLLYWENELDNIQDPQSLEILESQKQEANQLFSKFISKNYDKWFDKKTDDKPILSHEIFGKYIYPELLNTKQQTLFLVIDNMRFDQWKIIEKQFRKLYHQTAEHSYYSILPTVTHYARNAIFAGMTPLEIKKQFPQYWVDESDEEVKYNNHEAELLFAQLEKRNYSGKSAFYKISNTAQGKKIIRQLRNSKEDFITIVYNFIDLLSHAKTEINLIKELAPNDKAYRNLTQNWFKTSSLMDIVEIAHHKRCKLIITTDHGTINVQNPSEIITTKQINSNLRYKHGKSMTYNDKHIFCHKNPERIGLPTKYSNSPFIFAHHYIFFAYQQNYNYHANYYKDTFQHGGISLEEMIIPLSVLNPI